MRELTSRRCTIFNMLHNGVLALMYRANAVKVSQQRAFDGLSLSPLSNASQLEDYWAAFSKATARDEQPQSSELELFADQLCPRGWKELLATDLEVPFRVPHTHPSLSDQHRMRIRSLYATFVGLKRRDGSMAIEDQIEYKVSLGPLMVDRASPREGARSSDATIVQYYREPRVLKKTGKKNDLLDDEHQFSRVSLCCRGSIAFKRSAVEDSRTGWDLSTITDIQITCGYETLVFSD
ncbi:hypothetical protein NW766_005879 [Fusarium irregulare]|uniref:Uncharacterized protein n=1 Tax=Fusarium irregulare TaxID=2494466 RepID=A0A9W8PRE7_9HYPO|nr:hypothetical protein NW766_005879 [Fusarium irregulare]